MEKRYNIVLKKDEIYTLQNILSIADVNFRYNIKDLKNLFNNKVDEIEAKK